MNKIVLGLALLCLCGTAFAETLEVESRVVAATIYPDSAQITRQAKVNLKTGSSEVVFTNIPEYLDENTLTVSASGTAVAKILDAKIKTVFLEQAQSELVRKLEDEIQKLQDGLSALDNERTVLGQEKEYLQSIKLHATEQIPEDLITKTPAVADLDSLRVFIKEKWAAALTRELAISQEQREIQKALEKLKKELNQMRQAQRKEKRVASVGVEVERAGELQVDISYLMYQANWNPQYDARVDYEKQKVELSCLGLVKQTSGADWQGIEIALSTAKPTISGRMPELYSWILQPPPPAVRVAKSKMLGAPLEESLGDAYNYAASYESKAVEKQEQEAPMQYAQAEEGLGSVTYKIAHLVDIKSDGTEQRLAIFTQTFSTEFFYSATPKLSQYAYLAAKVTNDRENLLPAAVRVFLDNTYVGSSSIDAIGKGEQFDLFMGIDEGVKVKREKVKEETKEVWLAGIKRNNKVVVATYKITVENYKSDDIRVNVFDHFPVSQNDQIAVKILEATPKAKEEDYQDKKGVMRWELDIKPKEKKEIVYTYQLEYPREMHLNF
ncbi:MAG: mucoidy inhibitor MuiA family protein [Candidatus Omnitrophota bacterium]